MSNRNTDLITEYWCPQEKAGINHRLYKEPRSVRWGSRLRFSVYRILSAVADWAGVDNRSSEWAEARELELLNANLQFQLVQEQKRAAALDKQLRSLEGAHRTLRSHADQMEEEVRHRGKPSEQSPVSGEREDWVRWGEALVKKPAAPAEEQDPVQQQRALGQGCANALQDVLGSAQLNITDWDHLRQSAAASRGQILTLTECRKMRIAARMGPALRLNPKPVLIK